MNNITLYGAGGHCCAVVALIRLLGEYNPALIVDDNPKTDAILGVPVQKFDTSLKIEKHTFIAIGNNAVRKKVAEKIQATPPTFIHPASQIYKSASIGNGSIVMPGAVIDAGVHIGDFCIVNNNATVSHNARVGNFCHVAINAAITGGVRLGEGAFVAAQSVVLPNIKIGKWAVVGAGAVVTKDVPDRTVVLGNPARVINIQNE